MPLTGRPGNRLPPESLALLYTLCVSARGRTVARPPRLPLFPAWCLGVELAYLTVVSEDAREDRRKEGFVSSSRVARPQPLSAAERDDLLQLRSLLGGGPGRVPGRPVSWA